MLQIKDIKKEYKTGDLVQKALDGVSLNLRDNEFVAILGPSGSGKTTLLNIIGGLDRYDSGDLIINGVSTRKYKDRDWDSYRNHTIGFVFQSYNLIMHQNVLANVELALTISGISGAERRARAEAALQKVGLGDQLHKKPNQMSGGQMQRVAIARALVNDPDIVLADEPTGALDSETSVQVMDLLKEVAKDRLVVMVTHNPELARQYATRIVNISDGHIVGDTDPFVPDLANAAPPVYKNLGKASMSFLTALSLSFNNLKTKKARTFMVSFAGSIGIIGIALILALSSGVNQYIKTQEAETLSEYPLTIEQTGYDLTSLLSGGSGMFGGSSTEETPEGMVGVQEIANTMFDGVSTNDLASLKAYLESGESDIYDYVNSIEYSYDITPQIFRLDGDETYQLNPNNMFSSLATGSIDISSMMSGSLGTSIFSEMPAEPSLYQDEYDVKAGHWPESSDELVLVLSDSGTVSDVLLYNLGLKDQTELQELIDEFIGESTTASTSSEEDTETAEENSADSDSGNYVVAASAETDTESTSSMVSDTDDEKEYYSYDQFLGQTFRLVNSCDYYVYDEDYEVWTDRSDNSSYVRGLAENGRELTIVGIVQPKEDVTVSMLSTGIGYQAALITDLMAEAAESDVVKAQLADETVNIFTGEAFDADSDDSSFDMSKLFSVDEDALSDAFSMDEDSLDLSSMDMSSMDLSGLNIDADSIDLSGLDLNGILDADTIQALLPQLEEDLAAAVSDNIQFADSEEIQSVLETLFTDLYNGYNSQSNVTTAADVAAEMQSFLAGSETLQDGLSALVQNAIDSNLTEDSFQTFLSGLIGQFAAYLQNNLDVTDADSLSASAIQSAWDDFLAAEGNAYISQYLTGIRTGIASQIVSSEQIQALAESVANEYLAQVQNNSDSAINRLMSDFGDYLASEEAGAMIQTSVAQIVQTEQLQTAVENVLNQAISSVADTVSTQLSAAVTQIMNSVMTQVSSALTDAMTQMMSSLSSSLSDSLSNMFQFDTDAFADAISTNLDASQLQELMNSLMSGSSSSYESNLASLGYADPDDPYSISIYSRDFEAKNEVTAILDAYNQKMEDAGEDDKVITYTDMVATMMTSVTDMINAISYVLIAFVGISLVVSSIMIGVITYISVLERRKEIGILRAIGASKNNVAQVFNAETFITGLLAGTIGVVVSYILTFPINYVIKAVTEIDGIRAYLPLSSAVILVLLSIVLTMIAGLLPSRKASKSDPVTALRTE